MATPRADTATAVPAMPNKLAEDADGARLAEARKDTDGTSSPAGPAGVTAGVTNAMQPVAESAKVAAVRDMVTGGTKFTPLELVAADTILQHFNAFTRY